MLELKVYYVNKKPHLSMPVTGLLMLEQQKKVKLSFEFDTDNRRKFPYGDLLEVSGGGKRLLFDLGDGCWLMGEKVWPWAAEWADFVFQRSFSSKEVGKLPQEFQNRVFPFGFHFHVSFPGNPIDQPSSWKDRKADLFQRVFNGAPRNWFSPEKFETPPQWNEKPVILFFTRLWHPAKGSNIYNNTMALNQARIRLVTELKSRYGSQFIGGIQFDPWEVGRYGNLMVQINESKRKNYLRRMQSADICIASTGLHGSIGWKMAEYIAASKAIVSEPLHFEVPGDFHVGKNYLPFSTVEECLKQVDLLASDLESLHRMGCANYTYYQKYGRPDKVMANALRQVFVDFDDEID